MTSSALTYAIGDIHGHAELLDALLAKVAEHAAGRDHRLVFLGDFIDRGPDSAAALRTLIRLRQAAPSHVTCLMGNHERMLLDGLTDDGAAAYWLSNGGEETLASFGAGDASELPGDILAWIETLPTLHGDSARWYVHAGLRPGKTAEDTSDHDRLWIRGPFLENDHDFDRHVVHGHTAQRDGRPQVRPFRTNLDTAACYGQALTAGVFTDAAGPAVGFLQVSA